MFYYLYDLLKSHAPVFRGLLFRLFFSRSNLKVSRGLKLDGFPDLTLDKSASIQLGANVHLRKHVEIRAHRNSRIVIADGVRIDRGVRLLATNQAIVQLKAGARIGLYTVLNGGDNITVGKHTLVSGYVYLQSSMHQYAGSGTIQEQGFEHAPVVLGDDTWLGAHVVVMPGCTVGDGCVVGSNAVVTHDLESYTIAVGVPARKINERKME